MSSLLHKLSMAPLATLLALSFPPGARAAPERQDLTEVGLEELMTIDVISISRREQRLAHTPAAVSVITQEDIRRSGATKLPELLRLVPGLHVARIDTSHWAVTARGFNGQYSNKLLVMIDGRSVYTPLFSGVYWDMQDLLLEDVDRIEVIRGPGASLWGSNAVNGVINILTKPSQQTQGGLFVAGTGNEEQRLGALRYGGRLGRQVHYRIYSKYSESEPDWNPAEAPADRGEMGRAGFRADWDLSPRDSITMQSAAFTDRNHQFLDVYTAQPPFRKSLQDGVRASGGHAMLRWRRTLSPDSDVSLKIYYDRYDRREVVLGETRDTVDFDFQHRFRAGHRQQWLWGAEHRHTWDGTRATERARLMPESRGLHLFSAFVQDEVQLAPDRWVLTLGSRFEHNAMTGFEVQPTLRLLWTPLPAQAAWAAVSRAVRTPSRGEQDGTVLLPARDGPGGLPLVVTYVGNHHQQAEDVIAYELGYRVQASARLSVDAAAFYNVYRHLASSRQGAPDLQLTPTPHVLLSSFLGNDRRGDTYGLEVDVNWRPVERWRLRGGYTGFQSRVHNPGAEPAADFFSGSSPHHQFQAASYLDLTKRLQFDASVYRVSELPVLGVPDYTRCDVRLGWRPSEMLELSVGAQNLTGHRHTEFVSETFVRPSRIGRSVFGKLVWRF